MREDPPDPFEQLSGWAARTERRVRAGRRLRWLRFLPAIGVGVAAAVVLAFVVRSMSTGADAGPAYATSDAPSTAGATTSAVGATTSAASSGAGATTSADVAPTDAFAGTAAAGYPKGAAGITLPPARAVRGFTAAQVEAALDRVRAAMIAARLDEDMLVGHKPGRFVEMFAVNQRAVLRKDFAGGDFDTYATWIDPAVKLDAREEPRVSGRVTYTSAEENGIQTLRVTTNFVWVYAFDRADKPLAVAHDEIQWRFPSTDNLRTGDRGMWLGSARGYNALVDCAAIKRGLFAPTPPDAGATQPGEDQDALLRADHALQVRENC